MTYRYLFIFLLPVTMLLPALTHAEGESVEFDTQMLHSRGLPVSLNDYFKKGKRFPQGNNNVMVVVNGQEKTQLDIEFDAQGNPVLKEAQLPALGLVHVNADASGMINLQKQWPQTTISEDPNKNRLLIVVPQEAIAEEGSDDNYLSGGTAGILNYDLFSMVTRNKGGDSSTDDVYQAGTEIGFNFDDWIVRSRQNFSESDGEKENDHLYAYAQHTFTALKSVFQAGKINVVGGLFSTPQIYGMQLTPERALLQSRDSGATVSGIARSQARVEVRQAGALIYTTVVPSGPFTLTHISTLNNTADLQVNVTEQDGEQRTFVVPSSTFAHNFSQQPASMSVAMGRIDQGNYEGIDSHWLSTLSATKPIGDRSNLQGGVLLAENYSALAGQVSTGLANGLALNGKISVSDDKRSDHQGVQGTLNASMPLIDKLTFNASATRQNSGYRDLTDSENDDDDENDFLSNRTKAQYSVGLGWSHPVIGAFSLGWSQDEYFDETGKTNRLTVGWSKTLDNGISFSANIEWDKGNNHQDDNDDHDNNHNDNDKLIYASISIPFNESTRFGTTMSSSKDTTRYGVTVDQQVNDAFGYSLAASKAESEKDSSLSGTVRMLPHYAQLNAGYSMYGSNSRSINASASGGIVVHKSGILFSPYAIGDTLAVVKVADIKNTKVMTPQGTVWTNSEGYAVAPSMNAYRDSRLMLMTESLPKNVDIKNGVVVSDVARGSVTEYNFGVVVSRRALITVHMPDGSLAPKGRGVEDSAGNFLTTVAGDGTIFLTDESLQSSLWLTPQQGPRCQVSFTLNKHPDPEALYETYDAKCLVR